MSLIRQLLTLFGGIAVTTGYLTSAQLSSLTDALIQAIGGIAVLASLVWSWWHNRQAKAAAAVSAVTQNPVVVTGLKTPTVADHTISPTATADIAKAKAA